MLFHSCVRHKTSKLQGLDHLFQIGTRKSVAAPSETSVVEQRALAFFSFPFSFWPVSPERWRGERSMAHFASRTRHVCAPTRATYVFASVFGEHVHVARARSDCLACNSTPPINYNRTQTPVTTSPRTSNSKRRGLNNIRGRPDIYMSHAMT